MQVLITRPRAQAATFASALTEAGFEPVFFPVIEIKSIPENAALDRAISALSNYDWVVFTSMNGVRIFFERLGQNLHGKTVKTLFAKTKTAVIGPKTATALQMNGIEPDFIPKEYIAEAILPGLGDLHELKVLLPRAEMARDALPEAIRAGGGIADVIAIYQASQVQPDPVGLAALKAGVEVITFTSSSTVRSFVDIVRSAGLDPLHLPGLPRLACIGPITARTARDLGFVDVAVAEVFTIEGLVKLLHSMAKELL